MFHFTPRRRTSVPAALTAYFGLLVSQPIGAEPIPIATIEHAGPVDFQSEVLPILRKNCLACHNATDAESDFVLETPQTILKGGFEGPAVVPGKPEESLLLALSAKQNDPVMPPEDNDAGASDLTPDELGLIALWIRQGAKGDVATTDERIRWKQLPAGVNPIYAAAQSPEGRFVVAGRANQIQVYDVLQGRYVDRLIDLNLAESPDAHAMPLAHLDLVQSLAFSHDGRWIASGGYRTVKLWNRVAALVDAIQLPGPQVTTMARHGMSTLYVAGPSGTIRILERDAPEPTAVLAGHEGPITSLAVSPGQTYVASSGTDKTLRLWSSDHAATDSQPQPAAVNQLAWIDDHTLAGACDDNLLRIWSIDKSGKLTTPRELAGHEQPVTSVLRLSADRIVSASHDGKVRVWSLESGQTLREMNHGDVVQSLSVAEPAKRLISAGGEVPAKLWDLDSSELVAELSADAQLQWRRDQQSLRQQIAKRHVDNLTQDLEAARKRLTEEEASLKKTQDSGEKAQQEVEKAKQQDDKTAADKTEAEGLLSEAKARLAAAEKAVDDASDDPAKQAATSRLDEAKKQVAEANKALESTTKAAAKAAAQLIAKQKSLDSTERSLQTSERTLADATSAIRKLEPQLKAANDHHQQATDQAKQAEDQLQSHRPKALRGVFSPDGSLVVTSDESARISLWRTVDGTPLDIISLPGGKPVAIAIGPDRNVEIVTTDAKLYRVQTDAQWQLSRTIGAPNGASPLADRVTALSFSPDNQLLAVGGGQPSRSGELKIFRISDAAMEREIVDAHSDTILGLTFSPDGKRLASCGADRFMKVFDVASGQLLRAFEGHTHHVLSVSWRADGRVLATAGADKVVKLWNATDGSQIRTIQGFGKEVTSIQFAGASDRLFAACGDHNLYLCDMGGQRKPISKGQDFLYVVSTSLLGKSVVFGGHDSIVRVVDDKGDQLAELKPGS